MYWSPLFFGQSGPPMLAQNCGLVEQVASVGIMPLGLVRTLLVGPLSAEPPAGSLPKVLHGLPIGAGPL